MNVDIEIDPKYDFIHAVIRSKSMTEEVEKIKNLLESANTINVFKDNKIIRLNYSSIYRIYSENQKTYVKTKSNVYEVKMRLYEIEEMLEQFQFFRISKSEIVNLLKIKEFEVVYSGVLKITLISGDITYTSRRFVPKIKQKLKGVKKK